MSGTNATAGGGSGAEPGPTSAKQDAGGPAGSANATAGTLAQGGDGAKNASCKGCMADGGAPGGGRGGATSYCQGTAGGGGGGGWFGGGGGAEQTNYNGGGGGGSGYVSDAGADATFAHGTNASPPLDPDYVAGSAIGGVPQTASSLTQPTPATPGLIVVRVSKP